MRSSSLKVYSPVEYTGYKEKRSGHPSEPGSRTGNRKTTRKPKPILYRLRRFCKRLNWKRIGGLAVTTVVIVFAARGVVGMFSEHTQTKTAPVTTSSPGGRGSQPLRFLLQGRQAVSWEDVTDAGPQRQGSRSATLLLTPSDWRSLRCSRPKLEANPSPERSQ